jgi:hypothetical protein
MTGLFIVSCFPLLIRLYGHYCDLFRDIIIKGPESADALGNWMMISQDYTCFVTPLLISLLLHLGKDNSGTILYLMQAYISMCQFFLIACAAIISTPETALACALVMTKNWITIPFAILIAKCCKPHANGRRAFFFSRIAEEVGLLSVCMYV